MREQTADYAVCAVSLTHPHINQNKWEVKSALKSMKILAAIWSFMLNGELSSRFVY